MYDCIQNIMIGLNMIIFQVVEQTEFIDDASFQVKIGNMITSQICNAVSWQILLEMLEISINL